MARFENGYFKFWRKAAFSDIATHGFETLWVFTRLLAMANIKESQVVHRGKLITLKPGQLLTSLNDLSFNGKLDNQKIRRALRYLEIRQSIQQSSDKQGRIITICNWDGYQKKSSDDDKQYAHIPQTDDKQSTNKPQYNEEYKNIKNNNNGVGPNLNSSQRFELSMKPEAGVLKSFFNDNKMSQLENLIPEILTYFINVESFDNWYRGLVSSKTFPKDQDFANQSRYISTSLKKELGLIPSEARNA